MKQEMGSLLFPTQPQIERRERNRLASHIARGIIENELSERQRQVLILYYREQKNMTEIAETLGVTVSSVSHTHRRACKTVRSRLEAYHLYV